MNIDTAPSLNGHELPINKMAAFSYIKGEEYKVRQNPTMKQLDNPPKIKSFPGPKEHDLTGFGYSRLEVIGYYGGMASPAGSLWVVRCVCGVYELRRSKPIKKHNPDKMYRCMQCEGFANRKRNYEYKKLGFNRFETLDNY